MSFDDYITYFNSTCITKIHLNKYAPFIRETLRLSHRKDSFAVAKFHVSQKSDRIYITLHQIHSRLIDLDHKESYKPSRARIVVGKILVKHTYDYIKATHGQTEDLVLELN